MIASTTHYFGLTSEESRRAAAHVWRSEYERLLDVTEEYGLDAICVEFDALWNDTGEVIERLSEFVGTAIETAGLRRQLRHHAGPIAPEFAGLYERVQALDRRRNVAG